MNALFQYISSIYPLSKEVTTHLKEILKAKELPKKEYLLKAGHTCNNLYFIEKGLLRCYHVDEKEEVSSWFMKEGDMVVSVESFFDQQPSYEFIQALEDCTLYYISFDELEEMYRRFPEFNYVGRVLVQKYYKLSEQRLNSMRKKKAVERYAYLREYHPELIQRVPLKYLASYLSIAKETLCRIRRKK